MCLRQKIEEYEKENPKHKAEYTTKEFKKVEDILYSKKSLYLFKSESGRTKIGISGDPRRRLRQVKLSGYNAMIIAIFKPEPTFDLEACYLEKILHSYFKEKRAFGEWFNLTIEDIIEIIGSLDDIATQIEDVEELYAQENLCLIR